MNEYKVNFRVFTSIFLTVGLGFNYWQRSYVPRKFYGFTIAASLVGGSIWAGVRTSWYFVEQMDKLGQEYELSRIVKQDIFDTRPDMDTSTRA